MYLRWKTLIQNGGYHMIDEKYTYDQPTSYGVRNAICRAHQLLDTRWAPLMEFHKTERGFITSARNGKQLIHPYIR